MQNSADTKNLQAIVPWIAGACTDLQQVTVCAAAEALPPRARPPGLQHSMAEALFGIRPEVGLEDKAEACLSAAAHVPR